MTTVITTTMTLTCMVSLQSFHGRFVSGASSPASGATEAMALGSVRFGALPPVLWLLGSFLGCPVKPEAMPD
jgi:hypothetical protein